MKLFVSCVDHDVGPTPGGGFAADEIVSRVSSWGVGNDVVTNFPAEGYVVDEAEVVSGVPNFIEEFFNYYYYLDGVTPTLGILPDTARDTPAGETRNLLYDARLDFRDEELQMALKRANKRTIFNNL